MRRLSRKRNLQPAKWMLAGFTIVLGILWLVRGLLPAIKCGVLQALWRWDWAAAFVCIDDAVYEAALFLIGLMLNALVWIEARRAPETSTSDYNPTPIVQARNRQEMIRRVRDKWIESHLDQSLYQAVPMSLRMIWRPHRPGDLERTVPADMSTLQVFEKAKHRLLILGGPGFGKTTKMLDLASALLKEAEADPSVPIPVVFNLSSFIEPEQSLDDWLVAEFRSSYDVDEKYARYWLAHEEVALLLDGLDEVRADQRAGVVEKLNRFRRQHMALWLVICCRSSVYAELTTASSVLQGVDAVEFQALVLNEIRDYLANLEGSQPKRLWRALQQDKALREVADTPLMLNVMLLAAGQLDWSALPSDQGSEAVRSYIYDGYIRNMLARPRNTGRRYSDEKTIRWLHWLAGKMLDHGKVILLLERLTGSWLNRRWQINASEMMTSGYSYPYDQVSIGFSRFGLRNGLISGTILGFGSIVTLLLLNSLYFRLFGLFPLSHPGLIFIPILALIVGIFRGVVVRTQTFEEDSRKGRPNTSIHLCLLIGGLTGLLAGLLTCLIVGSYAGLYTGLFIGWFMGAYVGLTLGLEAAILHYTLRLVLFLDGSMPLNYVRFLDYCVDRVLLRRVGGGYMFIHRTMMEHIANLDLEAWKERSG